MEPARRVTVNRLRILIVRLSHLGDVVVTLPLLEALRHAHPDARIGWVVQSEYAGLLSGHPALDAVFRFERRGGLAGLVRLADEIGRFAPDWTIDAQGNWKSAVVALAARAPRRTGPARADRREPTAAWSANDSAPPTATEAARAEASAHARHHAVRRLATLSAHVAPHAPFEPGAARAFRAGDLRAGRERLAAIASSARARGSDGRARPLVLVHASRVSDVRSWPVAHVVSLARELARDHDVLVFGGPDDRAEAHAVAAATRADTGVRTWTEPLDLATFAGFVRAAGEVGAVLVGSDSGPLQLAWSAGLRVVMLAGPTDEHATGPWPVPIGSREDRHRVVRAAPAPACAPCRARTCSDPRGPVCLAELAPRDVARRVRELTSPSAS